MAEPFTLYKLIILYMLDKVDFPLTNGQISEFILEKGYTSYFKLQQALSELTEAELLREESTHNRTLYHLTPDGAQSIRYFRDRISKAIQKDIDTFLREKQYDLKNEVSVKSDYYRTSSQDYIVVCKVLENQDTLIELSLSVPSEKEAETISNNWQRKNADIYSWLMSQLL